MLRTTEIQQREEMVAEKERPARRGEGRGLLSSHAVVMQFFPNVQRPEPSAFEIPFSCTPVSLYIVYLCRRTTGQPPSVTPTARVSPHRHGSGRRRTRCDVVKPSRRYLLGIICCVPGRYANRSPRRNFLFRSQHIVERGRVPLKCNWNHMQKATEVPPAELNPKGRKWRGLRRSVCQVPAPISKLPRTRYPPLEGDKRTESGTL